MNLLWKKSKKQKEETFPLEALELDALMESLEDGVIFYDPNFKILRLNSSAERILGIKKEEALGLQISPAMGRNQRLKVLAQIILPTLAPVVIQLSESGWPRVTDTSLEDPPLKLRTALNRVVDQAGNALVFIKVIRDRSREEGILTAKREFLSAAAHQLRTPLTAISWALEALSKETKSVPDLNAIAEQGLDLTKKMLKIVNDLLNAVQIEEGKFGYKFEEISLISFLREIVEQASLSAEQAGVGLSFSTSEVELKITADKGRLGIALSNLIDNALRYNNRGGKVMISVSKDAAFAYVAVEDTGVGIPKEDLQRVFTKFYRGSNIAQLEPSGSGLGLFIVRNIIKNHGGEVYIDSELGRGTKVWFTLPLQPSLIPRKETVYDTE